MDLCGRECAEEAQPFPAPSAFNKILIPSDQLAGQTFIKDEHQNIKSEICHM